jgi:hypothetical protein
MVTVLFGLWLLALAAIVFAVFLAIFFVLQEPELIRWPNGIRWLAAAAIAAGFASAVYVWGYDDWPYYAGAVGIALFRWRFIQGFARTFFISFVKSFQESYNKSRRP